MVVSALKPPMNTTSVAAVPSKESSLHLLRDAARVWIHIRPDSGLSIMR